jgi:hypothetical protein
VLITVAAPATPLTIAADESYTLTIPADGSPATITAATNFGAYWGLQTLAQAVRFDFDARGYVVPASPVSITDKPKFAWRGILVDTDRHWLSLRSLYDIIDSLTYAKMNVLVGNAITGSSFASPATIILPASFNETIPDCLNLFFCVNGVSTNPGVITLTETPSRWSCHRNDSPKVFTKLLLAA